MNLFDNSFLCLDIGTTAVRGIGFRIVSGRIAKSAIRACESFDTGAGVRTVVDAIESDIGARFDSAYVTGNFGALEYILLVRKKDWIKEHKISDADIDALISEIPEISPYFAPMHIIPLRYDLLELQNITTPVGLSDTHVSAAFGAIAYDADGINDVRGAARAAHIMGRDFFDPAFLIACTMRPKKEPAVLLDLGASHTSVSVWTSRGPVFYKKIPNAQSSITDSVASGLDLSFNAAEKIKRENISLSGGDMDRFTPASSKHDFSKGDVNDIAIPVLSEILQAAFDATKNAIQKYAPVRIYLSGGGANITGIDDFVSNMFGIPVKNIGPAAAVQANASYIWKQMEPLARTYAARSDRREKALSKIISAFSKLFPKKKKQRFIPIMPSTLAFNMRDPATYARFQSGGVSMIHVDIMDGFYVDTVSGGIDELKFIREHTKAHLHVHLMTESPESWAGQAADAGADTIILSTGTAGVRKAIAEIKRRGKRAGIALHPETPIEILKPILREIDEILVMSVVPGAGGQEFLAAALGRIFALNNTRKRYGLGFKISVDGGINPDTAAACWRAGADFLVSGNYLANAPDFAIAVQSLLPQ
ncbi:MAG: ribulose-phosphate 3-epimerase [Rickettsiales bacterium]|jgi:ribulose-phosphate 3-epimerase|nr:ribulose-phosphate 3-epimerase [Rickettsiales bacterium]